ncbi:MAG: helix-turn-helix domain-containing protein [Bilifractor sp.]
MQNENFLKVFQKSGLSAYALSRQTGTPYTTIHRLCAGTLNINDCQYDTVIRIAACLGVPPEEIVNRTQLMRNVSGKYRGIPYIWKMIDGNLSLVIQEAGQDVIIDQDNDMTQPRFYGVYHKMAECLIDIYQTQKEAEKLCGNIR